MYVGWIIIWLVLLDLYWSIFINTVYIVYNYIIRRIVKFWPSLDLKLLFRVCVRKLCMCVCVSVSRPTVCCSPLPASPPALSSSSQHRRRLFRTILPFLCFLNAIHINTWSVPFHTSTDISTEAVEYTTALSHQPMFEYDAVSENEVLKSLMAIHIYATNRDKISTQFINYYYQHFYYSFEQISHFFLQSGNLILDRFVSYLIFLNI